MKISCFWARWITNRKMKNWNERKIMKGEFLLIHSTTYLQHMRECIYTTRCCNKLIELTTSESAHQNLSSEASLQKHYFRSALQLLITILILPLNHNCWILKTLKFFLRNSNLSSFTAFVKLSASCSSVGQ